VFDDEQSGWGRKMTQKLKKQSNNLVINCQKWSWATEGLRLRRWSEKDAEEVMFTLRTKD
jgi:hypothetical protein